MAVAGQTVNGYENRYGCMAASGCLRGRCATAEAWDCSARRMTA